MIHFRNERYREAESPGRIKVSEAFRCELVLASSALIGASFLNDETRPDQWSRQVPFAYGLGEKTGGFNCSGLYIGAIYIGVCVCAYV